LLLRKAATVLSNINEEHEGCTYVSQWFNVCCNRLNNFGEKLTFKDAIAENDASYAGVEARCSRAIDESGLSNIYTT
jgi:hypothetical protein